MTDDAAAGARASRRVADRMLRHAPKVTSMRWRGWGRLDQVQRVDLYTRQSLYLLLWGSVLLVSLNAAPEVDGDAAAYGVAGCGVVLGVAATFVLRDVTQLYPSLGPLPRRSMVVFLCLAAVALGFAVLQPMEVQGPIVLLVWVTAVWSLGGLRDDRWTALLVAALTLLPVVTTNGLLWAIPAFGLALFFVFSIRVSLWMLAVVTELDTARTAQAALAVAEERLRFSRDVHDVLGRRLSTIAVQAELAATLAERGDPRAVEQMLEVRVVAHEALREARELARGYRATDLDQELEGARSLLRSAGIEVQLDVSGLPAAWQEAAGWMVREAVTNVLRHSSATVVSIRYDASRLAVTNDGVGASGDEMEAGSGLAGLRERLAPLGATLTVDRVGSTFTLTATLPGPGPDGVLS